VGSGRKNHHQRTSNKTAKTRIWVMSKNKKKSFIHFDVENKNR
jgi:hypothetical protein